ncbi:MAG: ferritin-like domain-containing protein [Acidobacteriota bacterium]|nr:ferritin-like domain-containing protein [Acidobacteriota bacterium]
MKQKEQVLPSGKDRRAFLKGGMFAAGTMTALGAGLLPGGLSALEIEAGKRSSLTRGDIAILRFLQALEQIEADLWIQYSELGGTQDSVVSGVDGGNALYTAALQILDGDMDQYIHDNTDDEISHAAFLASYLESKGSSAVDLEPFRHLPSSRAAGANQNFRGDGGRLTNLMQLTIDTSFWSRYRSILNPDVTPGASFAQAVPDLNVGQHTAIPRTDADAAGSSISADSADNPKSISPHLQAIAFTAGFHFAFIEQGGSSLYPTLALKVNDQEVLRILLSIGPSETMHFQTWQDKAGNALPLTDQDTGFPGSTGSSVTFRDLKKAQGETDPESRKGDTLQANLIMPGPTQFLKRGLPPVSIIRPTSPERAGAVAAVRGLIADGLFIGHTVHGKSDGLVELLLGLAAKADAAERRF